MSRPVPPPAPLISADLVIKLGNRLLEISHFVQLTDDTTGNARFAIDAIWELTKYMNRFVETPEDAHARAKRDQV